MNILGHTYVASRVLDRLNKYVVFGSHVNDLVPFVPNSVFSFEEIHESPDKLLRFLQNKYPDKKDIALAMMAHSVKFGVDKFNKEIDSWLIKNNKNLLNIIASKIADCSNVSLDIAGGPRMHNYLWCGIDVYLLTNKYDFVKSLPQLYSKVNIGEMSKLLTECFNKDRKLVAQDINFLFEQISFNDLIDISGLCRMWKKFMAGLPEKDDIDINKAEKVFNYIYEMFKSEWSDILEKIISDASIRMRDYL